MAVFTSDVSYPDVGRLALQVGGLPRKHVVASPETRIVEAGSLRRPLLLRVRKNISVDLCISPHEMPHCFRFARSMLVALLAIDSNQARRSWVRTVDECREEVGTIACCDGNNNHQIAPVVLPGGHGRSLWWKAPPLSPRLPEETAPSAEGQKLSST